MKSVTLKIIGVTLACFFISYVAAKLAGVVKYPDDLGQRYVAKLREGHELTFDQEILIEGVDEIEVETVSSDIHISQNAEPGKMHAKFTGPDSLGFNTLRAGNKLYLKIAQKSEPKSSWQISFDNDANELALQLPAQVKGIAIKTVSGDVDAKGAHWEKFSLGGTSGDLNLKDAEIGELEVKTVSGDVRCEQCKVSHVSAGTVSGDVSMLLNAEVPQITASTTSGDIELRFEQKPNAKLEFASVSGELALEPTYGRAEPDAHHATVTIGAGKGLLSLKTTSGDVRVGIH